jgi:hypothetical protein
MILSLFTGWDGAAHLFLAALIASTGFFLLAPKKLVFGALRLEPKSQLAYGMATASLLVIWTLLVTMEFWVLGPSSSYIGFGDEGELSFPYFAHLAQLPQWPRPRFDPAVMGGSEIASLFVIGGSLFSLELWEFHLLGPDAGFILHKLLNTFLASLGGFLIARNGLKAGWVASLLIGFSYSVSFLFVDSITLNHGLGYGLIPLGAYVFVYRIPKEYYYSCCLAFALLISSSMSVLHSNFAFYVTLFCIAAYARVLATWRFILATSMLTAVIAFNWADVIYAMLTFAPYSVRGTTADFFKAQFGLIYLLYNFIEGYFFTANTLPVAAICLVVLGLGRRSVRLCLLALLPLLLAAIFAVFPFGSIGLGFLETLDPIYLYLASPAVLTVVLAASATALTTEPGGGALGVRWQQRVYVSFLLGLTVSSLVGYKYHHFLGFISGSSRDIYHIRNVEDLAWNADDRYRVLAGPNGRSSEYFTDNVLLAYGLPTLGGYFNLIDVWHSEYWRRAGIGGNTRGYVGLTSAVGCDETYALKNIDLLRVGGIGHVVSRTPLEAPELRLVSGPPDRVSPLCQARGLRRVTVPFMNAGSVRDAFIYEVPDPLPVLYFARGKRHSGHAIETDAFWDEVRHYAPDRIVSGTAITADRTFDDDATLLSFRRDSSGYTVETSAKADTMLVLSHPASPFWTASVDGAPAPVVPVNGIQLAVDLPAGPHEVKFTYERRLPSDYIAGLLAGIVP